MKRILIIIILVTLASVDSYSQDINCIRKIATLYSLNATKMELWRSGRNGCFGNRCDYYDSIYKNKMIIGMPKKLFDILFGKPDRKSDTGDSYTYECCNTCNKKGEITSDGTEVSVAFFFVDGKLVEISIAMA